MRIDFSQTALAAALALHLAAGPGFAAAGAPVMGVAVTSGAFRLNHATVRGNATLFEGALVETGASPARVDLANGARLDLESESAGRILGGHLALERGAVRIARGAGFSAAVEARGLTIQPGTGAAAGRIVLIGMGRVEVAAVTGSLRVHNSTGVLVAAIAAGKALALEPHPKPGPARVSGRLVQRDGHYLLTDETTNVTVEVAGSAATESVLSRHMGERLVITGFARPGAIPASEAAQLIEVAQVTPAPPPPATAPAGSVPAGAGGAGGAGGTAPAGAGGAGGAGGTGGGAAGAGSSTAAISVTMIAVIGGVAAAAVVGGLAAAGNLGGSTAAAISR